MAKYSVYGLVDPTDEKIRYIGISKRVYRRYYEHLHKIQTDTAKGAWISALLEQGHIPALSILNEEETETEAREKERYWIKMWGTDLTNSNHNTENFDGGTRIDDPELDAHIEAEWYGGSKA